MADKRAEVEGWLKVVNRTDRQLRNKRLEMNDTVQSKYKQYLKTVGKGSSKMTKNQWYSQNYPL